MYSNIFKFVLSFKSKTSINFINMKVWFIFAVVLLAVASRFNLKFKFYKTSLLTFFYLAVAEVCTQLCIQGYVLNKHCHCVPQ